MSNEFKVPVPANEPIKDYEPNSDERQSLIEKVNELSSSSVEIPIIIDGKEIKTLNMKRYSLETYLMTSGVKN